MASNSLYSNSGTAQSGRLSPSERRKAQETTEEAIKEAEKYTNPNIPMPLKIAGLVVLAFMIWKTG